MHSVPEDFKKAGHALESSNCCGVVAILKLGKGNEETDQDYPLFAEELAAACRALVRSHVAGWTVRANILLYKYSVSLLFALNAGIIWIYYSEARLLHRLNKGESEEEKTEHLEVEGGGLVVISHNARRALAKVPIISLRQLRRACHEGGTGW